jgi:hypothetical protein
MHMFASIEFCNFIQILLRPKRKIVVFQVTS